MLVKILHGSLICKVCDKQSPRFYLAVVTRAKTRNRIVTLGHVARLLNKLQLSTFKGEKYLYIDCCHTHYRCYNTHNKNEEKIQKA